MGDQDDVRPYELQLRDDIEPAFVVRVRAYEQLRTLHHGPSAKLEQRNGLDCFLAEPKRDEVRSPEVLELPLDLYPTSFFVAHWEVRPPGVEDRGIDPIEQLDKIGLPVGAAGDPTCEEQ